MALSCHAHGAETRVIVLNVGEGQAVLLQDGIHGMLVDTGHFGEVHTLLDSLQEYGVMQIEGVILTHLHEDHASGIFAVMHRFPQATIYESGHREFTERVSRSILWTAAQLDSGNWNVKNVIQDDGVQWRSFGIRILWPEVLQPGSLNSLSLVLAVDVAGKTIVVMGDGDIQVEKSLLERGSMPVKIDLLVVGHHGANDATSALLVKSLQPTYAVISVNHDNKMGYPDSSVVQRLYTHGIDPHLTGRDGDFVLDISSPKNIKTE